VGENILIKKYAEIVISVKIVALAGKVRRILNNG